MSDDFDPYYEWLGIPTKDRPPHAYRLLGVELWESNLKVIETAAEQRMLLLRNRQSGKHAALSQRLLNEVAAAERMLLDTDKRSAYDADLRRKLAPPPQPVAAVVSPMPTPVMLPPQAFPQPITPQPVRAVALPTPVSAPLPTPVAAPVPAPQPVASVEAVVKPKTPLVVPRTLRRRNTLSQSGPLVIAAAGALLLAVFGAAYVATRPVSGPTKVIVERPTAPSVAPPPKQAFDKPSEKRPTAADPPSKMTPNAENNGPQTLESLLPENTSEEMTKPTKSNTALPEVPKVDRKSLPPLPSAETLAAVAAELRTSQSREYSLATDAAKKSELAKKLFALPNSEAPERLPGVLREAARLTAEAGYLVESLRYLDDLHQRFEFDLPAFRAESFTASLQAKMPDAAKLFQTRRLLQFVERLIEEDRLVLAADVLKRNDEVIRTSRDSLLIERADELRRLGSARYREFKAVDAALKTLANNPEDGPANTTVGKYYCLVRGEFKRGLPYLAKGNDKALLDLAIADSAVPRLSGAQASIADGWWNLAETLSESFQTEARIRAGQWYREALRGLSGQALTSALERVEIALPLGLVKRDPPSEETLAVVKPRVYLDDLDEDFSRVSPGRLGRRGEMGMPENKAADGIVRWDGKQLPHALYMHPPTKGRAVAIYNIDGAFRRFRAGTGLLDTGGVDPASPITFHVYGDELLLWSSVPTKLQGVAQEVDLDVREVRQLRLEVDCPRDRFYAWATWLEPRLEGGLHPLKPTRDRWKRASDEVYLDDLVTADAVSPFPLAHYGGSGTRENHDLFAITADGERSRHALRIVPTKNGVGGASFRLGKEYERFTTRFGVAGNSIYYPPFTPLVFRVVGDGKELFLSKPVTTRGEFQECVVDVADVDVLRIEVRCPGVNDGAHAVWCEPRLRPKPAKSDADTPAITADRIVVTNTHNGDGYENVGAYRCNVLLYRGNDVVWQRPLVSVPWHHAVDPQVSFAVPAIPFNRVRVELIDYQESNAGLSEVQVFKGEENLAKKAVVSSSATYEEGGDYGSHKVTDGIVNSNRHEVGYWLMNNDELGWVELEWQPPEARRHAALNYPLNRRPHTAVKFKEHYYLYFADGKTWEEAQQQCRQMGGYLACANSPEENDFLFRLGMRRHNWLGATRQLNGGFAWIDGSTSKFVNWQKGQPDNTNNGEDRMHFVDNGQWNDMPNGSAYGFLCEWEF